VRSLQASRTVKKEGKQVLQALEQKFPLQLVVATMVSQGIPLQPMEVCSGTDLHP